MLYISPSCRVSLKSWTSSGKPSAAGDHTVGAKPEPAVPLTRSPFEARIEPLFDETIGHFRWTTSEINSQLPLPHESIELRARSDQLSVIEWGISPEQAKERAINIAAANMIGGAYPIGSLVVVDINRGVAASKALSVGLSRTDWFERNCVRARYEADKGRHPLIRMLVRILRLYTNDHPKFGITYMPGLPCYRAQLYYGDVQISETADTLEAAVVEVLGRACSNLQLEKPQMERRGAPDLAEFDQAILPSDTALLNVRVTKVLTRVVEEVETDGLLRAADLVAVRVDPRKLEDVLREGCEIN